MLLADAILIVEEKIGGALLDSRAKQRREVFARFGLAIHNAQCMERELSILLALKQSVEKCEFSYDEFDDLCGELFLRTLGGLITSLKSILVIPEEFENSLVEALHKRNWLIHHYFWDRSIEILTDDGREEMIHELDLLSGLFDDIDGRLVDIRQRYADGLGVTEELILETLQQILEERD